MLISSGKAKARRLQNLVAEKIRAAFNLSKLDVYPAIMGESGIDIKLSSKAREVFPFGIECKNQEKLDLFSALKQTIENAEKENLVPVLAITRNKANKYALFAYTMLGQPTLIKNQIVVDSEIAPRRPTMLELFHVAEFFDKFIYPKELFFIEIPHSLKETKHDVFLMVRFEDFIDLAKNRNLLKGGQ